MNTKATDEAIKQTISDNLERLRGALSYSELGRRCGTNASAISKIAHGTHMPGAGLLARLASALGCSVEDLLAPPRKKRKNSA